MYFMTTELWGYEPPGGRILLLERPKHQGKFDQASAELGLSLELSW